MKTSVVMTTYNGRRFLIPMLDSLRDQTRKIDEVLIFDDRSSDDTVNILNNYIKDNCLSGWKVKVNKKKSGLGAKLCTGSYVSNGRCDIPLRSG